MTKFFTINDLEGNAHGLLAISDDGTHHLTRLHADGTRTAHTVATIDDVKSLLAGDHVEVDEATFCGIADCSIKPEAKDENTNKDFVIGDIIETPEGEKYKVTGFCEGNIPTLAKVEEDQNDKTGNNEGSQDNVTGTTENNQ